MFGKFFVGLVTLASIYIGNELSTVYVPETFESPLLYKSIYLTNKFIGNLVNNQTKIKSKAKSLFSKAYYTDFFGFEHEYYIVRRFIEVVTKKTILIDDQYTASYSNLNKKKLILKTKIYDTVFNRVPVRVYSPIKVKSSMPFMVFTHGGGYSLGHIDGFDTYLFEIARRTNIIVISVNYRLSPEFAFPIPLEDSFAVLEYAIDNSLVLKLDTRRMIIAGDSSGGHLALALSQQLFIRRQIKPRLQVLIYPWIQMLNLRFPSHLRYKALFPTLNSAKIILWYLGFSQVSIEMQEFLLNNRHTLLIRDQSLRDKYQSYLDINLIPKEYKLARSYYKNYNNMLFSNQTNLINDPLLRNRNFASRLAKLADIELSPGLADLEILRNMPPTYMLVFEMDGLKDEQLIFAERLRSAGVLVNLDFNEEGFHGIATMLDPALGLKLPHFLLDNVVKYIELNL